MADLLAATNVGTTATTVSVPSLMLQLAIGLGVVLALIWVASKVAKGRLGKPSRTRASSTALSVLSRQTLGKGVHVAVVRVGSQTLVLGVTAHQVTRLADIAGDDALNVADLPATVVASPRHLMAEQFASAGRVQGALRQLQELTIRRA